ncbi:hypothetical protein PLESTB_001164200 [Pleodorina starrii]|uniref:Uncharacterized protein n=1 Tax=Pleodorina starrii TaxID=330485 RepID=A0A9W6F5X0_9CHLO|nr:hypothetical protein PLESTB_001164200 [Pleodorina starrii]GLC64761.1 hypothetical protein PLESTF_000204600 [Pleodorina starrii]
MSRSARGEVHWAAERRRQRDSVGVGGGRRSGDQRLVVVVVGWCTAPGRHDMIPVQWALAAAAGYGGRHSCNGPWVMVAVRQGHAVAAWTYGQRCGSFGVAGFL